MKKILLVLLLLFGSSPVFAQNTRAVMRTTNNAYFTNCGTGCITGLNVNAYNSALLSATGFLNDTNSWSGFNIFSVNPTFSSCTGLLTGNGNAPITCSGATGPSIVSGTTPVTGPCTSGFFIYNNAGTVGCSSGSGASMAIGGAITGGPTAGYGLYVNGTSLGQFGFGANVFTALGVALNGSGALAATTSPALVTPSWTGTASGGALTLTTPLAVLQGGTGTTTPALVQGTNVTITGTWPNQTINSAAGMAIGGTITGSPTSGYGLYVNGSILGQFAYGSGVFTALGVNTNNSGGAALVNGSISVGDCVKWSATGIQDYGAACGGAVTSVSNSDSSLTITPTTGLVVASLNTGHANTWTGTQTFSGVAFSGITGSTQCLYVDSSGTTHGSGSACGSGGGISFPQAITGTVNSGGIPYFSSTTVLTSSNTLAANALMVGGGAGVAPSTVTTGTGVVTALGVATDASGGVTLVNGAPTVGNCLKWSATGVQDNGSTCGGGTFPVTVSGTINSGGIPYFNSTTQMSTSNALTASSIVVGGGAGAAPYTVTTGSGVLTALGNTVNTAGGFGTIGSSGSNVGLLNTANTFSALQTFSSGGATKGDTTASASNTAGYIGERILTTYGGGGISTGVTGNLGAIALTAGHWMCQAYLSTSPSGSASTTAIEFGISTTASTFSFTPTLLPYTTSSVGFNAIIVSPVTFIDISTSTTYFVNYNLSFTNTMSISGSSSCLRTW